MINRSHNLHLLIIIVFLMNSLLAMQLLVRYQSLTQVTIHVNDTVIYLVPHYDWASSVFVDIAIVLQYLSMVTVFSLRKRSVLLLSSVLIVVVSLVFLYRFKMRGGWVFEEFAYPQKLKGLMQGVDMPSEWWHESIILRQIVYDLVYSASVLICLLCLVISVYVAGCILRERRENQK